MLAAFAAGVLVSPAVVAAAEQPSPLGLWTTLDDHTGTPRGLVRVYQQEDRFFARIEGTLIPSESGEICAACTDDRKNQPVVGMVIMRNIRQQGGEYGGGDILDPDSGEVYDCEFHLDHGGSRMVVRGFVGIALLGRSQIWLRAE